MPYSSAIYRSTSRNSNDVSSGELLVTGYRYLLQWRREHDRTRAARPARRSARSPAPPASRSRRSRACSTSGPASPPRRADAVLRVVRDHGFTANRSARALSGGRTGPDRRDAADGRGAVLLGDPLGRRRGAVRAGHAHGAVPDAAPPRARGHAARPPHARYDRRRRADVARGVERRAQDAAAQGLRVRDRRPARGARRGHPGGLGRQRLGRARGDRAPALARPPAHRRDHRAAARTSRAASA